MFLLTNFTITFSKNCFALSRRRKYNIDSSRLFRTTVGQRLLGLPRHSLLILCGCLHFFHSPFRTWNCELDCDLVGRNLATQYRVDAYVHLVSVLIALSIKLKHPFPSFPASVKANHPLSLSLTPVCLDLNSVRVLCNMLYAPVSPIVVSTDRCLSQLVHKANH